MIPLFKVRMPESVDGPLLETLHSGFIGQGKRVDEFERLLCPEMQSRCVLAVNSGTSAIHLALRLAGVGPGDSVICSPCTCTASNMPVLERGARIVWADVDPRDGNMDPYSIEALITPETKAIIPVHWGGYVCDMDSINEIALAHDVAVIEDAAHALGAMYKGARVGNLSRFTCFSFQAIKALTTVDGGALACKEPEDYRRGKLLRWYGINRETPRQDARCEDDIAEYGYKFHMNDVAATIGIEGLKGLHAAIGAGRFNAFYYNCEITDRGLRHVKPLEYRDDRTSSYWLYTLLVDDRPSFVEYMTERGIHVSRVHARNDKHTCFRDAGNRDNLPGVDEFDAHQISIPCGWWIGREEREAIMDAITEWERGRN